MKILQSNDLQADTIYFGANGKRLKITKVEDFYILLKENNEKQFEACLYKKANNLQDEDWLNGLIAFESYEDYLFFDASKEKIRRHIKKDFDSTVDNLLSSYLLKFLETKQKYSNFKDNKQFVHFFQKHHSFYPQESRIQSYNSNVLFERELNSASLNIKNETEELEDLKNRLEKAVKTNNNFAKVLWLLFAGFIAFGYFIK